MSTLVEKIDLLSREQAIEAATSLSNALLGDAPLPEDPELDLEVKKDPFSHLEDVDRIARMVLQNAARSPEHTELAEAAIEGAGTRNIILSGDDIIALTALGVYALKILRPPLSKEKHDFYDEKGQKVHIEKVYSTNDNFLITVIKKLFHKS